MGGVPTGTGTPTNPALGGGPAPTSNPALGGMAPPSGASLPDWATSQWAAMSPADQSKLQSAFTSPAAAPAAVENLGFPTATPTQAATAAAPAGFTHTPYLTATDVPHIGAPDRVIPPAAAPTDPNAPPKDGPMDWVYTGNLPMHFDTRAGEFGKPWTYSATGPSQTAGYGAVGRFGGVAGYGPQQEGLADQKLLPEMKAGTKLEGADIDQRNRVRREDYDRYMKLYGVGYDLPAYQQALNGLVHQQNAVLAPHNYFGSGG
jgi:hypothetical protein